MPPVPSPGPPAVPRTHLREEVTDENVTARVAHPTRRPGAARRAGHVHEEEQSMIQKGSFRSRVAIGLAAMAVVVAACSSGGGSSAAPSAGESAAPSAGSGSYTIGFANGAGTGNGWPGHSLKDVGCILAGHGGGLLPKTGRQIRYPDGTPLSNLWLTLAQMTGVERKEFGRSTGTLSDLG